jgi:chorismate synthase
MIRYFTAGESHGPELNGIVEGVPAGLEVLESDIEQHLVRRQKGYGRGGRMAFEKDHAEIRSGVRFSKTTGAPISLTMVNRAYEKDDDNWPKVMAKDGDRGDVGRITLPRPGHADLAGLQKYGFDDIRPVIERSSARETAMRVACCSVARILLKRLGIEIGGHVIQLGTTGYEHWEKIREKADPIAESGAEEIYKRADKSEVRCLDDELSGQMREEIKIKRKEGTSLGGIYEIIVTGVPAGLGSYVHWDRKLDGQLAQAIMSTQAMKGVEIGIGFEAGRRYGHRVHDEIYHEDDLFKRRTNRLGGFEGGVTTGMPIILRGVMKPIPTMIKPLRTADIETKEEQETRYERSDVCALPRAVVVAESVLAPVIANAILEKYGGDSMNELLNRYPDG